MEDQIIQEYIFPRDNDTIFRACDFHLEKEEEGKDFFSTSIPSTLKEENTISGEEKFLPLLILFYFNNHQEILEEWEKLGPESPKEDKDLVRIDNEVDEETDIYQLKLKKIRFRSINLDYEKKLYHCFKNLTISNPFHWSKITGKRKNYFILFYLNTFPVEFYSGSIDIKKIEERYYKDGKDNYFSRFLVTTTDIGRNYIEKKKEEKFKVFDSLNLKDKYFKALENDKPFPGIEKGKYYKIIEIKPGEFKATELHNY